MTQPNATDVRPWAVCLTGLAILIYACVLIHLLVVLWPPRVIGAGTDPGATPDPVRTGAGRAAGAAQSPEYQSVTFFRRVIGRWRNDRWVWAGVTISMLLEVRLILLVLTAGGIGALIHVASSFADFVGNRNLARSWLTWYALRPVIGMSIAVLFYFAVRGGFLTPSSGPDTVNVFGVVSLAGLAGMFSKRAADKLEEMFSTLFKTDKDLQRKDKLTTRRPLVRGVNPKKLSLKAVNAGSAVLTVEGENFDANAKVLLGGKTITPASRTGTTTLAVRVLAEHISRTGSVDLWVENPEDRGGKSEPLTLDVEE